MDDLNVTIFAQAKLEYTKQLVDVLYMNMYDGICSIYEDSKQIIRTMPSKSIVSAFRTLLEKVPKWNSEIIDQETNRIINVSKCDWLDDLLTAVFISHTRILMSIGPNQNFHKINVTIPKTTTFIHKTYINIAREVWKNPYLFNENVIGHEYQRNMKQLEDMIKLIIEDTIRRQLPIKDILKEHLETYDEPKQTTQQQPIDMSALVEELRKATQQTPQPLPQTPEYEPEIKDDSSDESDHLKPTLQSIFQKEEDIEQEQQEQQDQHIKSIIDQEMSSLPKIDDIPEPSTPSQPSPPIQDYQDPGDPSDEQIKLATQNIVLNDITEPVTEETYDNTDLFTSSPKKDESKLKDMLQDLTSKDIKPVTTLPKQPKPSETSVVKIDTTPTITEPPPPTLGSFLDQSIPGKGKVDDITNSIFTDSLFAPELPKPELLNTELSKPDLPKPELPDPTKTDTPKTTDKTIIDTSGKATFGKATFGKATSGKATTDTKESKSNLVIKLGDVPEDKPSTITDTEGSDKSIAEQMKDKNAQIMKEVISVDKQSEQMEDTATLDNFFSDIQKMNDPMKPIKEETKYTLFEDAGLSE